MKKTALSMVTLGLLMGAAAGSAWAAPDWSKAPKRDITVFHPGTAAMEWVGKKSDHSGTAGLKKGETCVGCHEEKGGLNFNFKRLADKELEPAGAPKTMNYPVTVQAAYDASNLYIRLTFKAPTGGANKGDKVNEVKATMLFPDDKVPLASQVGCWASCHNDARTMPGADDKKTKYTKEGSYQLMQWASGKGAKVADGTVTTERKMDGGSLGAKAEGAKSGETYTVTFTRKNPGEGKVVPFGVAIHADNASGRFHHVSLGYTIGIGADGDVKAAK
ncbi:ethylbenzene dehydrogenase-related protein [Curvibacter sp. APW13]|uniref:ethylbenzene dehydrogenase-related protein n=1 Tax=Curvibacter sp. APW13 TaxID=3077236 RepID=UPI0028E0129E|nr:ethylbenzene dehydrogenase-related protein [Curvibacter sp. APW13]MDT8991892.1 ethylbenzene dehydrogenase-related protein [Curvibacter sp. APW13]